MIDQNVSLPNPRRLRRNCPSLLVTIVFTVAVISILSEQNLCHGMPTPDEESFSREVSTDSLHSMVPWNVSSTGDNNTIITCLLLFCLHFLVHPDDHALSTQRNWLAGWQLLVHHLCLLLVVIRVRITTVCYHPHHHCHTLCRWTNATRNSSILYWHCPSRWTK